jgi:hypothetical protein
VVERTLQVCPLDAWHVELLVASAVAGTIKAIVRTRVAMAFISSSNPLFGPEEAVTAARAGQGAHSCLVRAR